MTHMDERKYCLMCLGEGHNVPVCPICQKFTPEARAGRTSCVKAPWEKALSPSLPKKSAAEFEAAILNPDTVSIFELYPEIILSPAGSTGSKVITCSSTQKSNLGCFQAWMHAQCFAVSRSPWNDWSPLNQWFWHILGNSFWLLQFYIEVNWKELYWSNYIEISNFNKCLIYGFGFELLLIALIFINNTPYCYGIMVIFLKSFFLKEFNP